MVIFGRSVFYLFGRLVNNSAVQFSIFSAVWIRPYVEVRFSVSCSMWGQYVQSILCLSMKAAVTTTDVYPQKISLQPTSTALFVCFRGSKAFCKEDNEKNA